MATPKKQFLKTEQEQARISLDVSAYTTPRNKYTKEERENEADAKILRKANQNVTRPITRVNRTGRPKKYTPTKFRNKVNDYFCHCEKNDKIPSIKGLMLYMKLTPACATLYGRRPEYQEIFDQIRLIISDWLEADIYTSKGQTSGKIAYMQNIHNWTNKTETEITNKEMTIEEARAKIESLAPFILETIKNNPELLKQIMPSQPVIEAETVETIDE